VSKLLLSIMGAFAEFERSHILERQREGIAIAKAAGKYKGRPPSLTKERIEMLPSRSSAVLRFPQPVQSATNAAKSMRASLRDSMSLPGCGNRRKKSMANYRNLVYTPRAAKVSARITWLTSSVVPLGNMARTIQPM
jgi:DNA invertase Pin-like site-specific DNA recombinase